jgi:hypothetical protein
MLEVAGVVWRLPVPKALAALAEAAKEITVLEPMAAMELVG